MSAARGDVEHYLIFRTKDDACPLPESWRAGPEINGHVENLSPGATDQLGLRMRFRLKVNTPQRTFARIEGSTALGCLPIQAVFFKLFVTPCSGEEAPLIAMRLDVNLKYPGQPGFDEFHNEAASFLASGRVELSSRKAD